MAPNSSQQLLAEIRSSSPYLRFQYVTLTFGTADTDRDIPHTLAPDNPNLVDYEVVRKDRACDVYEDATGTRKPWQRAYLVLRCSAADAVVTLRLSVRRT